MACEDKSAARPAEPAADEDALENFAREAPQLCPAAFLALGARRACELAFAQRSGLVDSAPIRPASSPVPLNSPEILDQHLPVHIVSRDAPGDLRRCLTQDGYFKVVARAGAVPPGKARVLWGSSLREWAEAPAISQVCANSHAPCFGHSFGFSEEWLIAKDALGTLVRLAFGKVEWFCTSYRISKDTGTSGSLRNELATFVGDFLDRKARGEANTWIIKPANLSRSRGIIVSDSLPKLLSAVADQLELGTACVACKYVERPLLFRGKYKVDLRFLVALRSAWPLDIYVYDHFIVRTASAPYTNGEASDDLASHLTVTQYSTDLPRGPQTETSEFCSDFRSAFGQDPYAADDGLVPRCHAVIWELFQAAFSAWRGTANEVIGVRGRPDVRTVYGLDLIINVEGKRWSPIVLECNYKPDLSRVLEDRPKFLDQLFFLLFGPAESARAARERRGCLQPTSDGSFLPLAPMAAARST